MKIHKSSHNYHQLYDHHDHDSHRRYQSIHILYIHIYISVITLYAAFNDAHSQTCLCRLQCGE